MKKTAKAVFQLVDKRGSELKNSEPPFEIPLEFSPIVKRLGLYEPTMLGLFWTLPCPIGHLLYIHGSESKHRLHRQFFKSP